MGIRHAAILLVSSVWLERVRFCAAVTVFYHRGSWSEANTKEEDRAKAPAVKWSQSPDITNDLISSIYCLVHLELGFCCP